MRALLLSLVLMFILKLPAFSQSQWENRSGNNPTKDNAIAKFLQKDNQIIGLHQLTGYSLSDDNGLTWRAGENQYPSNSKINDVFYKDSTLYVLTGAKIMYASYDSGTTFTEIRLPDNVFNFEKAWDRIIITKTSGPASWSADSGKTWTNYQPVLRHFVKNLIFWNDTLFSSGSNSGAAVHFYSVDTLKTFVEQRNIGFPNALAITGRFINFKGRLLLTSSTDYLSTQYERVNGRWEQVYPAADFDNVNVKLIQRGEKLYAESADGMFLLDEETDSWTRIATWSVQSPRVVNSSIHIDGVTLISTSIPGNSFEPSLPRVFRSENGTDFIPVISPLGIRNSRFHLKTDSSLWVFTGDVGYHESKDEGKTWNPVRYTRYGGFVVPVDAIPSDTGFYAILRDAVNLTATNSSIVEFSPDFKHSRNIQSDRNHAFLASNGVRQFVVKGSELLVSSDTMKTFTSIRNLAGQLPLKPVIKGDTVLAGNLLSIDAGETFQVAFAGSAFNAQLGKHLATTIVDTAIVAYTESTQASGNGVFRIDGNNRYARIIEPERLNNEPAIQLLAVQNRLFIITANSVFYTGNMGQSVELVAEIPEQERNSGAKIQYASFVENTLYISRSDGFYALNVGAYQNKAFVQTLDLVRSDASDSTQTGAFIEIRGRALPRGENMQVYADVVTANQTFESEKVDITQDEAFPHLIVMGLRPNQYYNARVNAIVGNDTLFGEPIIVRTEQYRFWEKITPDSLEATYRDAVQMSDGRLVAVGTSRVIVSDDLGKTWTPIDDSPTFLLRIVVMNGDTLVAGSTSGTFYHSADRGETWDVLSNPNYITGGNRNIFKLAYSSAHHVLTAVYGEREQATNNVSYIIKSINGGRNWDIIDANAGLPANRLVYALGADAAGNLYVGVDNEREVPVLYRSTDGAQSFTAVLTDSTFRSVVNDIEWVDGALYVLTKYGVYRSTDGEHFVKQTNVFQSKIFVPISEDEYIAAYSSDRRYFSYNREYVTLNQIGLASKQITNGFPEQNGVYMYELKSFSNQDSTEILAFGTGGVYRWRTGYSALPTNNEQEEMLLAEKPISIQLGNYPNPFNPTTTIFYELPNRARVELTVFDVLGRRVAHLVRGEMQSAGKYHLQFNASGLASGVYMYQLRAGEFVKTGKMLLVK